MTKQQRTTKEGIKKEKEINILKGFLHRFSLSYTIKPSPTESAGEMDAVFITEGGKKIGVELTKYTSEKTQKEMSDGDRLKRKIYQVALQNNDFINLPIMNITVQLHIPLPKGNSNDYNILAQSIVDIIILYPERDQIDLSNAFNTLDIITKLGREKTDIIRKYVYIIRKYIISEISAPRKMGDYNEDTFFYSFLNVTGESDIGFKYQADIKVIQLIVDNKQEKKRPDNCKENYLIIDNQNRSFLEEGFRVNKGIYTKVFFGAFGMGYCEIS